MNMWANWRRLLGLRLAPGVDVMVGQWRLRPPQFSDFKSWAELRGLSRDFLEPWEPAWTADELSWPAFARRVRLSQRAAAADRAYYFFIFDRSSGGLRGGITLHNVRRGVAQMASIGYWVGAPFARQGIMTAALTALCRHGFEELVLHRLEAACIPSNLASASLLRRCGFVYEGEAKAYLQIAGKWQDHLLFSKTST